MRKKELVDIFFKMVRINSESGEEKEFITYIKKLFTKEFKAKCTTSIYGNLIVKIPGKNTTHIEPVLFGVHADTVKPGKNIIPILKNGIIYSEGETVLGADDKAGIIELFEAIKTAKCHPPLEIIVSKEEEIGLLGSKNINDCLFKSKIGFVIDGSALDDIIIGGPSYMMINVKIIGKGVHAGMAPEKGISSIKAASYAISMLKEGWVDKETTVNVGVIRGGEVVNSVPEKTDVKVECRSLSHEKCLKQSNLIKEVFLAAAKSIGANTEIKMNLNIKAYQIPEDGKAVKVAKEAINNIGLSANVRIILSGTDAFNYCNKGIETVVIGVGDKSAHTTEENIAIKDIEKAVDIIKYILEKLCQDKVK